MKTLIIDNYDSFTYNLYHYMTEVYAIAPIVIRNDSHSLEEILELDVDAILISPGPGHPEQPQDFGVCADVIRHFPGPILGICLGHQGIASVFGAQVILSPEAVHGQIAQVQHNGHALFEAIPQQFEVVRYHSLMVAQDLPDCLETLATTDDGIIMAIAHRSRPIWGVQYHPESICSQYGKQLLSNFKQLSAAYVRPYTRSHQIPAAVLALLPNRYQVSMRQVENVCDAALFFHKHYASKKMAVWLDSSRSDSKARFSIMGCLEGPLSYHVHYKLDTQTIIKTQNGSSLEFNSSIFDFLRAEMNRYHVAKLPDLECDFHTGFIGYFAYEMYAETMDMQAYHSRSAADAEFLFLDRAIIWDHQYGCCYVLALHDETEHNLESWFDHIEAQLQDQDCLDIKLEPSKDMTYQWAIPKSEYLKKIQQCLDNIRLGESYEICLTNRILVQAPVEALSFYQKLRTINPTPYAGFLHFDTHSIACSSMERFLKMDVHGQLETKPIKGTMPRGTTLEQDQELKYALAHDIKFRSENLMIVDLLRNDLAKICCAGSVQVPKLMAVETYENVHQLVTTICGQLEACYDAIDVIKAVFPGGSMTGAPKKRTLELIHQLEERARGVYSGTLGYLSLNGALDFNIVIRTAEITAQGVEIGVGGAIIALSDPEQEFEEIELKAQALLTALAMVD